MDFEELKNESHEGNVKKNRSTMVFLMVIFLAPVLIAYSAYFLGWFSAASQNKGELLAPEQVLDIEDFRFSRGDGSTITGKDFETLYWWLLPVDGQACNKQCLELNLYMLNQTYLGLGKEMKRINPLLIVANGAAVEHGKFPIAYSEFSDTGVKALSKTKSDLNKDLPANYIYLVDPLGNIFMRYPLVDKAENAAARSKDLRTDLKRLFKYSRLG